MQILKTSKSREGILNKIRIALGEQKISMPFAEIDKEPIKSIYANNSLTIEEQFAEAFISQGGKFVYCANELELLDNIYTLHESRGWQKLLCAEKRLVNLFHNNKLNIIQLITDVTEADACVTECEMLIARTGSILLSSKQYFGRATTAYYSTHIVIAYANQIVSSIQDGLVQIIKQNGEELPSMINLNTGPCCTFDIENISTIGGLGTKEVFCFYVNA